jgi:hypothetical protein
MLDGQFDPAFIDSQAIGTLFSLNRLVSQISYFESSVNQNNWKGVRDD